MRIPHFWEPEETIGAAWHAVAIGFDAEPTHENARASFEDVSHAAGMIYRAMGGAAGTDILGSATGMAKSRVTGRRRLGRDVDHVTRAAYDGATLALPHSVALFSSHRLNRGLYIWLAALAATTETPFSPPQGALACDLAMLRAMHAAERRLLDAAPGLRVLRAELAREILKFRRSSALPPIEDRMESTIRSMLGDTLSEERLPPRATFIDSIRGEDFDPSLFDTPPDYKPFRPVALWPLLAPAKERDEAFRRDDEQNSGAPSKPGPNQTLKARRERSDQADRPDSLILYRFESILSWTEFFNLNRATEDEEEDNARKAARDLDEVTLVPVSRTAKKRLLFHLDLSPLDVERARLEGETTYPEWDWKRNAYLPDHVRVEERIAEEKEVGGVEGLDAQRRIERVRLQFEALRPRRRILNRQSEGFDLDLDEIVRAHCDLAASGQGSERLYRVIQNDERDFAVSLLVDVSRSTESSVGERPVIDIAREAVAALIGGVEACGDQISVHAFSSLRRDRVMIDRVKGFDEKNDETVRRRIMGLSPRFYTRMGAAVRHASRLLSARAAQRRLLLIITDGKPNDLDHYDGRHGIEDTRRAVEEARRLGHGVFALTVDARAQDYISYLFGKMGYAIIPDPERLIEALPEMYRHVAG